MATTVRQVYRTIDVAGGWAVGMAVLLVVLSGAPERAATRPAGPERTALVHPAAGDFSVVIVASSTVAEPGRPVVFSAASSGGVPPVGFTWSASNGATGLGANFSTSPSLAANLSATVLATDAVGSIASSTFVEPVAPALAVSIGALDLQETGVPFDAAVTLSGGVPPFDLLVTSEGSAPVSERVATDGVSRVLLTSDRSGPQNLSAAVVDGLGVSAEASNVTPPLGPSPAIVCLASPPAMEVGPQYDWTMAVTGGVPPYRWSVLGGPITGNSSPAGSNGSGTLFELNGRWTEAGNRTLEIATEDSFDLSAQIQVNLSVARPLTALPLAAAGPGEVALAVQGGVPPYTVLVRTANATRWLENLSGATTAEWSLPSMVGSDPSGALEVADAAGGTVTLPLSIAAPPAGAPPSGSGDAGGAALAGWTVVALVGGVFAGALAMALVHRGRASRAPSEPPPPPALEDVERILRSADSIDRNTVLAMGEDRGISREAMEAGLQHWTVRGRIETDRGPSGEELLRWLDDEERTRGPG